MSCDVGKAMKGWRMSCDICEQSSFSKPFRYFTHVTAYSLFHCFTYVTDHFPTLPLLHLRHSSFCNPSFASTSQALHLRHLASRPCCDVPVQKLVAVIMVPLQKCQCWLQPVPTQMGDKSQLSLPTVWCCSQ